MFGINLSTTPESLVSSSLEGTRDCVSRRWATVFTKLEGADTGKRSTHRGVNLLDDSSGLLSKRNWKDPKEIEIPE